MTKLITQACNNSTEYPKNLLHPHEHPHRLKRLQARLQSQISTLCSTNESVFVWDRKDDAQPEGSKARLTSCSQMRQYLGLNNATLNEDPVTRFVFILANDARSPLLVSYDTLSTILTYHQVMPAFLELILTFGQGNRGQCFHYSNFCAQSPLLGNGERLAIPELGRSSSNLQLCYNLRTPEKDSMQPEQWPWYLEESAVYHSFDLHNGRITWIMIKANDLLLKRILASKKLIGGTQYSTNGATALDMALATSLATHLVVCQWAVEEWRWYINFLESQVQVHTEKGLYIMADDDRVPDDWANDPESEPGSKAVSMFKWIPIGISKKIRSLISKFRSSTTHANQKSEVGSNDPAGLGFAFDNLQKTQGVGEKANEALLTLKSNEEVLVGLRDHYEALFDASQGFSITDECQTAIAQFERRLKKIESTFRHEQTRVETLLRLVDVRKNLVYGLLNHENMKASKLSMRKMEAMTAEMHEIAKKTQKETVSMRIITFITLIFLPGTFVSTIMSTDIISWSSDPPRSAMSVSGGAVKFFIVLTAPLVLLTFIVWATFYWSERRKDARTRNNHSMLIV